MANTDSIAGPQAERPRWVRYLIPVALLFVLVIAFFAYRAWTASGTTSAPPGISQAVLEEQYGLQVRLIGVTAAGGLIDFRLKTVEADKARLFLEDPGNLPISLITAGGTEILAADSMDEDFQWEDGGILFMLLPNPGGEIQPGNLVTVKFGEMQLEPLPAQ